MEEDVRRLQRDLIKRGYGLPPTELNYRVAKLALLILFEHNKSEPMTRMAYIDPENSDDYNNQELFDKTLSNCIKWAYKLMRMAEDNQ